MQLTPAARAALAAVAAIAVLGVGAALVVRPFDKPTPAGPPASAPPSTPAAAAQASEPTPTWSPKPPATPAGVWVSWAYLDSVGGELRTGGGKGTNPIASVIKPAIAADYLRRGDPSPAEERLLRAAIVDSDNAAAEQLYRTRGRDAVTRRLISKCDLFDTRIVSEYWGLTRMSAADVARLGGCLRGGGIVAETRSAWVLDLMRKVRGEGRFGIIEARPTDRGRPLAIKNGWIAFDGNWHVNCLAVGDWWTLSVMTRYPAERGRAYGARQCRDVARAVIPPDMAKAPGDTPAPSAPAA